MRRPEDGLEALGSLEAERMKGRIPREKIISQDAVELK
jgi:hypothetical protein